MFNNLNITTMQGILLCVKIVGLAVLVGRFLVRGAELWINFRIWRKESKHPSASSLFRRSPGLFFDGEDQQVKASEYGKIIYPFSNFGIIDFISVLLME